MSTLYIRPSNPLPSGIDWGLVASTLGVVIGPPDLPQREVVDTALVAEREPDLLGTVRQEVDGLGERTDVRVGMVFELDGASGGRLAVADSVKDKVPAAFHDSSPVCSDGDGSPTASSIGGGPSGFYSPDPACQCHETIDEGVDR